MFGLVWETVLEAERSRRRKAEADAEALRGHCDRLLVLVHELLDRVAPKPIAPGFGLPPGLSPTQHVSATEILKVPAVGKRGIRERNAAARDADLRDEVLEQARIKEHRRVGLTPAEQELLDRQIPQ